jgi:hypothetical protein
MVNFHDFPVRFSWIKGYRAAVHRVDYILVSRATALLQQYHQAHSSMVFIRVTRRHKQQQFHKTSNSQKLLVEASVVSSMH